MKSCLKQIIIAVAALLLLLLIPQLYVKFKIYQVQRAGPDQILAACREMITKRSSFRNDRDKWPSLEEENSVLLLPPIPENVPKKIRELHPKYVEIRQDNILINFSIPFARVGILGFLPGAQQYGTYQYVDGLWFWNGNKSTSASGKR